MDRKCTSIGTILVTWCAVIISGIYHKWIAPCLSHKHMFHGTRHYIFKIHTFTFYYSPGNVIDWEAKTTLVILFWRFFCNNESLFRSCTHEITVTTGCSFCHCWKKILIYLGYLPDFDRRCSGSKILFFRFLRRKCTQGRTEDTMKQHQT